ncbi:hypothetical protein H5S39_03465 [Limosilactobacillus sp. STM3_1]|nr:hypothetical protein [Limosilactobacillus rudii]
MSDFKITLNSRTTGNLDILSSILNSAEFNIKCPNCNNEFKVKLGDNTCPNCHKIISVSQ